MKDLSINLMHAKNPTFFLESGWKKCNTYEQDAGKEVTGGKSFYRGKIERVKMFKDIFYSNNINNINNNNNNRNNIYNNINNNKSNNIYNNINNNNIDNNTIITVTPIINNNNNKNINNSIIVIFINNNTNNNNKFHMSYYCLIDGVNTRNV
ncbi:hypothetical protein HELRODRAFT_184227 [Helobdella robusta]|uniref:Uncharacterized protein n=1 Tax=Helobdella robusta TaxID=6412 RepID=T1FKS9_HELRO|nr:hypothetical protein HELRODRAFT_184227 [Helobdella robusta]ESO04819.1 hypothetical protein HELRODRAFT_184227 [Helobdella robusta]